MKQIKIIITFGVILYCIVLSIIHFGGSNEYDTVLLDHTQTFEELKEINKKLENGSLSFEEVKKFYDELQKSDDSLIMVCNRIYAYAQIVDALGSKNIETIKKRKDDFINQINAIHMTQLDTVVINQETFNSFKHKASNITRFDQLSTCYIPTKYVCDYCHESFVNLTKHKNESAHWYCKDGCQTRFGEKLCFNSQVDMINHNELMHSRRDRSRYSESRCDFCGKECKDLVQHKNMYGHWKCTKGCINVKNSYPLSFKTEKELLNHYNAKHRNQTRNINISCEE